MKKSFLLLIILLTGLSNVQSQHINIHSITTTRQPAGDGGYTLDGTQMSQARLKLLDPVNFGSTGTYGKSISIVDMYQNTGSLEHIADSTNINMFYFGIFDAINFSLEEFSAAELDSFYNWSLRGGKLIIGAGSPNPGLFEPTILNSRWGFNLALVYPSPVMPTTAGTASKLFNGPFGAVTTANQGGSSQGYFTTFPANSVVLADDGAGHPTMYLDCKTLDLVVADGDIYTGLGGITVGNTITGQNDKLWANTIAFMDSVDNPPSITMAGNVLSTGVYPSYQWSLNGTPISGATNASYTTSQFGTYTVQVPLKCGCTFTATQNVYPVGIVATPEHDAIMVSPNPWTGQEFMINGITTPMSLRITDINGRQVDQILVTPDQPRYRVNELEKGIYFFHFSTITGQIVRTIKMVKQS